jgi:hypothetical protein
VQSICGGCRYIHYVRDFQHGRSRSTRAFTTKRPLFSRIQLKCFELFARRSEIAELIDGRGSWRERKRVERLRKHLLQVRDCADTNRNVRIEILARCLWDEGRNISDGRFVDVGLPPEC